MIISSVLVNFFRAPFPSCSVREFFLYPGRSGRGDGVSGNTAVRVAGVVMVAMMVVVIVASGGGAIAK